MYMDHETLEKLGSKLKRESEPVDLEEVHRLHAEASQLADQMTAMVPSPSTD